MRKQNVDFLAEHGREGAAHLIEVREDISEEVTAERRCGGGSHGRPSGRLRYGDQPEQKPQEGIMLGL